MSERLPTGWDEARIKRVLDYYESQTDEEAAAEHDAAHREHASTLMEIPVELVPLVRALLARHAADDAHAADG